MENVSRALLMAAGVLLAVLIISIATLLFRSGANVVESYQHSNEQNELNTFNSNFTRMISGNDTKLGKVSDTITIYDIITVANFAWNNNIKYVENPLDNIYKGDPRMLSINICDDSSTKIVEDLQNLNQHAYDLLIQQGYFKNNNTDKAYEPTTMYYTIEIEKYNSVGRVQIINFRPKDTSGAIASQLGEAMKTIKDKESLYKRSIDY